MTGMDRPCTLAPTSPHGSAPPDVLTAAYQAEILAHDDAGEACAMTDHSSREGAAVHLLILGITSATI